MCEAREPVPKCVLPNTGAGLVVSVLVFPYQQTEFQQCCEASGIFSDFDKSKQHSDWVSLSINLVVSYGRRKA